jgi:hypothetical protein
MDFIPEDRESIFEISNFTTLLARAGITVGILAAYIKFKESLPLNDKSNLTLLSIVGGASFASGLLSKTVLPAIQDDTSPEIRTLEATLLEPLMTAGIAGTVGYYFNNNEFLPIALTAGMSDLGSGFMTPTAVNLINAFV